MDENQIPEKPRVARQVHFPISSGPSKYDYVTSINTRDEMKCVTMKVKVHGKNEPVEVELCITLSMKCDKDKINGKEGHWWCFYASCPQWKCCVMGRYSTFLRTGHIDIAHYERIMALYAILGFKGQADELEKLGFDIPDRFQTNVCPDCGFEILPTGTSASCTNCATQTFSTKPLRTAITTRQRCAGDGQP